MSLRPLELQSEAYGSTGNIGGNLRRVMGTPSQDPLRIAIREALQNIADAAKLGRGPEFRIRVRRLSHHQRQILKGCVFRSLPACPRSRSLIQQAVERDDHVVLEFCDFHTTGLGGPTRADRIPAGSGSTDFIDFVRNIGSERDTEQGGGTYGFGKMALYGISRCSTILVDSQPAELEASARRLIACHAGRSFAVQDAGYNRPYTGRHWWGRNCPADDVVDPVQGDEARELASLLGLPERASAESGTSIMILDLEHEERDLQDLGQYVTETVLWNFWPRLMRDVPPSRRFHCRIEVDGQELSIPDPETIPPLELYCKAMKAARLGVGEGVHPIRSARPKLRLGSLAIARGLHVGRTNYVPNGQLIPAVSHHVALMRPVELVVKYMPGQPYPDDRVEWAGVFLADHADEVEEAFARSEPPAHDDWIPSSLPRGRQKTIVNVALREIRSIITEFGVPQGRHAADTPGPSLAGVADQLGAILSGVEGDAPSRRTRSARSPGGGKVQRARASRPVFVGLAQIRGTKIARFRTTVSQDADCSGTILSASAFVAVDGGKKASLDEDQSFKPEVLGIGTPDGTVKTRGGHLRIDGRSGVFEILIAIRGEVAVIADAEVLMEGDA
ncbi:MAG: hypothetical protein EA398_00860 [Deltaproteobacteria bacterium]|nr:MAG: hypothetical protein EA398_00860 [Deltaproteobacteria bacterium]